MKIKILTQTISPKLYQLYKEEIASGQPVFTVEIVYLAAFVDAEGTIVVVRTERDGPAGPRPAWNPNIRVYNANRSVIQHINKIFGGSLLAQKKNSSQPGYIYSLTWNGRKGSNIARLLLPYLKIKKEQAKVYLEYPFAPIRSSRRVDIITMKKRDQVAARLRELKNIDNGREDQLQIYPYLNIDESPHQLSFIRRL